MTRRDGCMLRRDFIKGTLAALTAPGIVLSGILSPVREAGAAEASRLAVMEREDPFDATVGAVERLGGMASFVGSGATVLVKPNIGWDRRVEQAANTHPEVIRALIDMSLDAGAARVIILDRTCNDARRCYRTSGVQAMVEGLSDGRVSLEFVRENRFRRVRFTRGKLIREWPLYSVALDADVIINVPIAKHHSISGVTLGMKNLMGLIGGNRGTFHSQIGQKLADLTSALTPHLNVLDASRILFRNGPTGGRLEDVKILNTVAASVDPVALDAFGTTLFGLRPEAISSTVAGHQMGLGEMDLNRVRIIRG